MCQESVHNEALTIERISKVICCLLKVTTSGHVETAPLALIFISRQHNRLEAGKEKKKFFITNIRII